MASDSRVVNIFKKLRNKILEKDAVMLHSPKKLVLNFLGIKNFYFPESELQGC